jgi:N-ethylmaleimide reductase
MSSSLNELFRPIDLGGGRQLPNRMVMVGMTRTRAESDGTPNDLMAEYYAQRADAGLIITESTSVSVVGRSFLTSPAMHTTEQAIGWKKVVDGVHARGGRIVLQLNHVGRVNNLQYLARPVPPVGPSAIAVPDTSRQIVINIPRVTPFVTPRALETDEVPLIAAEFAHATRLAVFAGFDGVEIHADSGYLIHQFLSTNANKRTDRYGGSVENRARLALEVLDAVIAVNGPEYVAMKLTPGWTNNEIEEENAEATYRYLLNEIAERGELMFLHFYFPDLADSALFKSLRPLVRVPLLVDGSLSPDSYAQMIAAGQADMAGFGRAFIANPDLPARMQSGTALAEVDYSTLYLGGAQGYTTYGRQAA